MNYVINKILIIITIIIMFKVYMCGLPCHAEEFHLIELNEVKVSYMNFLPGGRDPLISYNGLPNRSPGNQLDLTLDSSIFKYGYFNSLIHSLSDAYADSGRAGQFRLIGLNLELGIRVSKYLDIFYYHYSQHLLDTTYQYGGFPLLDGVGIHVYLYRKNSVDSIF